MRFTLSSNTSRVIFFVLTIICVAQGFWYFALPIAIISAWLFPLYIEALILGLVYDSLFGLIQGGGMAAYMGLMAGAILFIVSEATSRFVRK